MTPVLAHMKTYGKQAGEFRKSDAAFVTVLVRRDAAKKNSREAGLDLCLKPPTTDIENASKFGRCNAACSTKLPRKICCI